MKLILTQNEFAQVRTFIGNTKNAEIVNNFNSIFKKKDLHIHGYALPSKEIQIEVNESEAVQILKIIADKGSDVGAMASQGFSMSMISGVLSMLSDVRAKIASLF